MTAGDELWEFALRVYGSEGVADACLALQDRHGLDVSLLLYCCWLGRTGTPLTATELERVLAFAGPWAGQVIRPLRQARRWLKDRGTDHASSRPTEREQLRAAIKAAELDAERLQLRILQAMTHTAAPRGPGRIDMPRCMNDNLALYLHTVCGDAAGEADALLRTVVLAAADTPDGTTPDRSDSNPADLAEHGHG